MAVITGDELDKKAVYANCVHTAGRKT